MRLHSVLGKNRFLLSQRSTFAHFCVAYEVGSSCLHARTDRLGLKHAGIPCVSKDVLDASAPG